MDNNNTGTIKAEYQIMDEIDHILARPGTYVGNIHTQLVDYNLFVPSKNKILNLTNISVNKGALKMFDEIITNSIDERIKSTRMFDINRIDCEIWPDGTFKVRDDGGIPVIKHQAIDDWLPIMIFGMLRTSSNYGDSRDGSGLNGLGAKLTNIYSSEFVVVTADGKNKFTGVWCNNMRELKSVSVEPCKEHFTEITAKIEINRFGLERFDNNMMRVFQKRCIEGAAISPGLEINFTAHDTLDGLLNSSWKFKNFKEFVEIHVEDEITKNNMVHAVGERHEIIVMPSIGYNFGLVNGAACSNGTHIRKVELQYYKEVQKILAEDNIDLITEKDILAKTSIFVSVKLINPDFDSQAKDELSSKIPGSTLHLQSAFYKSLRDNEIITQLKDYYKSKYLVEKQKQIRKMNREIKNTKSSKFHKCNNRNPRTKMMNEMFIFEGTSAQNGFRKARNPEYQMAYMLRGKMKNTFSLNEEELFKNQEAREMAACLNLQLHSPKTNLKECNAGKIIFATDADYDGYHITGLLIVFYGIWFPELFIDNRIYRLLAPIGIATKGSGKTKDERFYYNYKDYDQAQIDLKGMGFTFKYKKGLGALNDDHYKELIQNKKIERITLKQDYKQTLRTWFDKSVDMRKAILLEDELFEYTEIID